MQDTALYQYLLGLQSPWTVSRVILDINGQRVDVWAEHPEDVAWVCPHCTKRLPLYDHAEERTWRHLDSCQFQTHLHARIPRVACGEHGVVQVTVPWAEPRSRFTLLFERLAIDVLRQCDVSGATRILRISWDEAWGVMQRAVTRGRVRKQARMVRRMQLVDGQAVAVLDAIRAACGGQHRDVPAVAQRRREVGYHDLAATAHVEGVGHEEQALAGGHAALAALGMIRRHWT